MKNIIKRTYITLFTLFIFYFAAYSQTQVKVEPVQAQPNKVEIKTEKEIKGNDAIKITDEKVNSQPLEVNHSKECKNDDDKDCSKHKTSAKMSKDCCKVKSGANKTKIENEPKTEIKESKPEIK